MKAIFSFFFIVFSVNAQEFNFEGIVKLSNCSASLVKFYGQPIESNAYVLTNGHCLEDLFLSPGQSISNWPVEVKMQVFTKSKSLKKIKAFKIAYATMTGTDLALYELEQSYDDLSKMGIKPFVLSKKRPKIGAKFQIISGFWENGYSCKIHSFVHQLKEGAWIFSDSIQYEPGCDVIAGTSGSPLINSTTKEIIGVNNTGNLEGEMCTIDNACEISAQGKITYKKGSRFGQQVYMLYSCIDQNFKIDLNNPKCKLND